MKETVTYEYNTIPKLEAIRLIDSTVEKDIKSINMYKEYGTKDLYRLEVTINRRNENE